MNMGYAIDSQRCVIWRWNWDLVDLSLVSCLADCFMPFMYPTLFCIEFAITGFCLDKLMANYRSLLPSGSDGQRRVPQKVVLKKKKKSTKKKNRFCSLVGKRILRKSKPNFSTPKWQQRAIEAETVASVLRTVILKKEKNFWDEPWNFLQKIISDENHWVALVRMLLLSLYW